MRVRLRPTCFRRGAAGARARAFTKDEDHEGNRQRLSALSALIVSCVLAACSDMGLPPIATPKTAEEQARQAMLEAIPLVADFQALAAVTPEEKARAAYFDRAGQPLLEQPPGAVIEFPGLPVVLAAPPPGAPPPTRQDNMRAFEASVATGVCRADAVAVGQLTPVRVLLNLSGTWLFTDYSIAIERWLRSNGVETSRKPVIAGLSGGHVRVGERILSTTVSGGGPVTGERMVLHLCLVQGKTALVLCGSTSLREDTISGDPYPVSLAREEYLRVLERASTTCSSSTSSR